MSLILERTCDEARGIFQGTSNMAEFTTEILSAIKSHSDYLGQSTAVETGTGFAETTQLLTLAFSRVFSVELSSDLYKEAVEKQRAGLLPSKPHLELIHNDSAVVVPKLCSKIDGPCLWYLDAHWCNGGKYTGRTSSDNPSPLQSELLAIANRKLPDTVVVDDVHAFGRMTTNRRKRRRQPNKVGWGIVSPEWIASQFDRGQIKSRWTVFDQYVLYLN